MLATLKEEYNGGVQYHIGTENRGWAYMFNTLENARTRFKLEDYGLSEPSLEQVSGCRSGRVMEASLMMLFFPSKIPPPPPDLY